VVNLKEHNKRLQQRLRESEREEHSHTPLPTPQTHQSRTVPLTHQTHHTLHTHLTCKSSKTYVAPNDEDKKGHPFTYDIIAVPLPDKWRGLTIKLYDGSTNSNEHLNIFKTQMTLYTTDKVVWCKVFPTSLQEGPLGWCKDPNTIATMATQPKAFKR